MKMEAVSEDVWRTSILRSKGRCRLVVGSAFAEEVEAALERGEMDVLDSEEADEARADLTLAIELFGRVRAKEKENDKGKGKEKEKEKEKDPPDLEPVVVVSEGGEEENDEDEKHDLESEELGVLLTEAFVTLANLTRDPNEREALYAHAKAEAGSEMDLDLDADAECDDGDDKMDESR